MQGLNIYLLGNSVCFSCASMTVRCAHASQETRARYEHSLVQIMNQYGVHNEAEVVSGCISKFAKHR